MEEEKTQQPPKQPVRSNKSKLIKKKSKFIQDPEEEKRFDQLKRKYANAVAFLLVKNVGQSQLREYFNRDEETKAKYELLKKFRLQIIEARPKSKQWVDKPFYLGLKLGPVEEESSQVTIILGECVFKQKTSVVSSRLELEGYLDTIAKIIESEKIWSDPEMLEFDVGERDDISLKFLKKMEEQKQLELETPV